MINPIHFKIFLTFWIGIGVVTALFGQALNFYLVFTRRITKLHFNLTWIINAVIIYGIWKWL